MAQAMVLASLMAAAASPALAPGGAGSAPGAGSAFAGMLLSIGRPATGQPGANAATSGDTATPGWLDDAPPAQTSLQPATPQAPNALAQTPVPRDRSGSKDAAAQTTAGPDASRMAGPQSARPDVEFAAWNQAVRLDPAAAKPDAKPAARPDTWQAKTAPGSGAATVPTVGAVGGDDADEAAAATQERSASVQDQPPAMPAAIATLAGQASAGLPGGANASGGAPGVASDPASAGPRQAVPHRAEQERQRRRDGGSMSPTALGAATTAAASPVSAAMTGTAPLPAAVRSMSDSPDLPLSGGRSLSALSGASPHDPMRDAQTPSIADGPGNAGLAATHTSPTDGTSQAEAAAAGPVDPHIPASPLPAGDGAQPALSSLSAIQPASGPAQGAAQGVAAAGAPDAANAAAAMQAPAHQVSAALVSLSHATDGAQSMTLRLQPAELGQVEIRIDRPQDAPARVDIAVERPETMTLLLHDQPQLQRALDQAGVPADGRSLTLHLAPPQSVAPTGGADGGMATNAGSGQGGGHPGTRPDGNDATDESAEAAPDDTAALPRWLRAGLDITA